MGSVNSTSEKNYTISQTDLQMLNDKAVTQLWAENHRIFSLLKQYDESKDAKLFRQMKEITKSMDETCLKLWMKEEALPIKVSEQQVFLATGSHFGNLPAEEIFAEIAKVTRVKFVSNLENVTHGIFILLCTTRLDIALKDETQFAEFLNLSIPRKLVIAIRMGTPQSYSDYNATSFGDSIELWWRESCYLTRNGDRNREEFQKLKNWLKLK